MIYAHTNSPILPTWDTNLGSPTLICARSWILCGITPAIRSRAYIRLYVASGERSCTHTRTHYIKGD